MPRDRRLEIPGGIYHVIARGIERRDIYRDPQDREEFIRRLAESLQKTCNKCYGWALMSNHFHLVIRTGKRPLGEMMRKLLTGYAVYFNRRHKRSGYLFQNRYKSILCQEDVYVMELVRYVHLNPLRGGLVKDIQELNRYPWSGHAVLIGNNKADWQSTGEILERFGRTKKHAIRKYMDFITDGQHMGRRDDLIGGGLRRSAGGWSGVLELKRSNERWQGDERVLGDGDFVTQVLKSSEEELIRRDRLKRDGWDLNRVAVRVCELMTIQKNELLQRSRMSKVSKARELFAYWVNQELGISGKQIADYLDVSNPAITKSIRRGEQVASENNLKLIS